MADVKRAMLITGAEKEGDADVAIVREETGLSGITLITGAEGAEGCSFNTVGGEVRSITSVTRREEVGR